ncbi:14910_t:CDS:2, partial [Cetraspora pellucida]
PTALFQKFPNKSERVKNHLKKCKHFIDAQDGREVILKILGIGLEEMEKQDSRSHTGPLDKYAVQFLTKSDKKRLETLLLHATVSAGILLQWVQNKEVRELFHFLNPSLELPGCRALGGRILNCEIEELKINMEIKLKSDSVGPTLAFDSWTN